MILSDRFNYSKEFTKASTELLNKALGEVPCYRPWQKLDPGHDFDINLRYDMIPELTKQMIRDGFPTGLMPIDRNLEQGLREQEIDYTFTSGTTGDRVVNIWDQDWWNRSEQASWQLNSHLANLTYPQKEAKLASSFNVGINCEEDLPYEYRIMGGKLYLNEKTSIIQWQDRHYLRMIEELNRFAPVILETNPSLLAKLCYFIIDRKLTVFSPKVITFTYEFVSKIHKKVISEVFNSAQLSSYGTTETGFVLVECEDERLHQNTEFARIDFHPLKDIYGGPKVGRILVSTFNNPWNIVVKFDTGDLVRLHNSASCSCGCKNGMIIEAIEGRVTNSTFSVDGKLVTTKALDDLISQVEGIRDYHIIQTSSKDYTLNLMTDRNSTEVNRKAESLLKQLYGADGNYTVNNQKSILPGPAGKFRRTEAELEVDWNSLFI